MIGSVLTNIWEGVHRQGMVMKAGVGRVAVAVAVAGHPQNGATGHAMFGMNAHTAGSLGDWK
jgi:hypothetical protein